MVCKQISSHEVSLTQDISQIILSYSLTYEGKRQSPSEIAITKHTVTAVFDQTGTITDRIREEGDLLVLNRHWKLNKPGSYRLQASFSSQEDGGDEQIFIPAVWYQDNLNGKGCFPSAEQSSYWSFLETRMSIPSCAQLSNGRRVFTCASEAATEERFLSSVTADRHSLIISIPGSEWPYSYRGKLSLIDTSDQEMPVLHVEQGGLSYERAFYLASQTESNNMHAFTHFVELLPKQKQNTEPHRLPWDQWMEYKLTRLINMVHVSEDGLGYLIMGEGNKEVQDVYQYTSASFLVKSLEAAYELAQYTQYIPTLPCLQRARAELAHRFSLANDSLLFAHVAKRIGDFFLQAEQSEGIFQDNYDLEKHIWGGYLGIGEHPEFQYMVNSRCNGEAMKYYVLLSLSLRSLGIDEGQYISLARRVARFYCEAQLSSGSFGRWWTDKGKPGDIQGTNGAYIGSFFATLIPHLNDNDPLKNDMLSAVHQAYTYYAELAFEGAFYGDTLDADSCDKEAGIALLSFFLDLYELEQDKRHLESAQLAAEFIVQWIWQQDSYLPPDSPLGQIGFSTMGMTSVSVAHHHLDFYGLAIAYEFLRFAKHANKPFYEQQAKIMLNACRQLVATERQPLGRDESFLGWQPEQLNHTYWEYFDRPELMNGHFDIDIAWVTVLTLGSYQMIQKHFPHHLEE